MRGVRLAASAEPRLPFTRLSQLILALHAGHNSSAVIGDETGVLYAVQEERLRGEKNYWGFPSQSLRSCLEHVGAKSKDLAAVVYGGRQAFVRYHARDDVLKAYRRQAKPLGKLRQRVLMPVVLKLEPEYGQSDVARSLAELGLSGPPFRTFDHHTCHAASAHFGLRRDPEEENLVLTADGMGDQLCASVRVMGKSGERLLGATHWANSLGAIYSWVTYLTGFVPLEHEYKLMGMAPYASSFAANEVADVFARYLGLSEDGLGFRRKTLTRTNDLGERIERDLRGRRFDHICAGLQEFTERLLADWAVRAVRASGVPRVRAAGGVFMNVKANKRIGELRDVAKFEAFPSCGDETLPFGAYYLEAARRFGNEKVKGLRHLYLGDVIDATQAERLLQASRFSYERPPDMARAVAELLAAGHPVARSSGAMEFGARALGNRSILADPMRPDVVRVINRMVKKRDFWMPFAPLLLADKQDRYLLNPKRHKSPYMMMTFDTQSAALGDVIAAVHNADLTCRAQLLEQGQNPEMEAVLQAFEALTGRSVILNTSFNLHGFPVVRDAADALHVFENSGLKYLVLGPCLVTKRR